MRSVAPGPTATQFSAFGQVRVLRPFKMTHQETDAGRGAVGRLLTGIGPHGDPPGARSQETASLTSPKLIPSGADGAQEARGRNVYFDEEDD
jgi:hypothetical protein